MTCKNPIALSGESSWPRLRQIPTIRSGNQGDPELFSRAPSQKCDADAFAVALGLLFRPEGPPVAFIADRESVLNGDAGLVLLSIGAPGLAQSSLRWEDLITCVRAAIDRPNALPNSEIACFGDVRVDFATMEVARLGEPVILTAQELKTLKFFVTNPRRVISREELLNEAWGYDNYPSTRTVDNHVLKLRQKLESDPADPVHFLTVHRVGYRFVP